MRHCKFEKGDILKHRNPLFGGFFKVDKILKKRQEENKEYFMVVKCFYSENKDFNYSSIKYIRPICLVKCY